MTDNKDNKKTSAPTKVEAEPKSISETKDAKSPQKEADKSSKKISASEAAKIAAQAKLASQQSKTSAPNKAAPNTAAPGKPAPAKPSKPSKPAQTEATSKISKVGVLALIIALAAGAGTAGHYYWQQQQNDHIVSRSNLANLDQIKQIEQSFNRKLQQSQAQFMAVANDLQKNLDIAQQKDQQIEQLQNALTEVISQKPTNSEVSEAEYLVRMAGRVLWLEKNVDSAIALLQDADNRLSEVNDPRMLSIRQLLHEDIEQLKLLPRLQTDEIILSFMGLAKQVGSLPLASLQLPEATDQVVNTELSEDINDWKQNLAKTWHSFKEEFITVRRRTGQVDALMEPQFQRNLYHNLELKLQQIQWAASQKNSKLYVESIGDLQRWLDSHFDMSGSTAQQFKNRLAELKAMPVNIDYPNSMASLTALQNLINESSRQAPPPPPAAEQDNATSQDEEESSL